jgi:hypothetical protein
MLNSLFILWRITMKTRKYWMSAWMVLIMLAAGTVAWSQTAVPVEKTVKVEVRTGESPETFTVVTTGEPQSHVSTYTFVATEMGFESKVVKGVPFSADTVTEFIQVLGNGQRIYRNNVAALYRDSEGRTRREQTIGPIGTYAAAGEARKTIFINDPVSGTSYVINPAEHSATKTIRHQISGTTGAGTLTWVTEEGETIKPHVSSGKVITQSAGTVSHTYSISETGGGKGATTIARPKNLSTEPLGTQMIEGVSAEGTRTIDTIPAGAIGNETPIEIVSERWYSEELGIVVKTVRNDPLSGNNTYQLKNIRRGEPSADLFQVPSDFSVKESVIKLQTTKK